MRVSLTTWGALQTSEILDAAPQLVGELNSGGAPSARLMGSCAVAHRCPGHLDVWANSSRTDIPDVDLVLRRGEKRCARAALKLLGYQQNRQMIIDGARFDRLFFWPPGDSSFIVEVIPSPLELHHTIPVAPWDVSESTTLPLTELFLTKMQYDFLLPDDILDVIVLLLESRWPTAPGESISVDRVAHATGRDWALSYTLRRNLAELLKTLRSFPNFEGRESLLRDIRDLQAAISDAPKSSRWYLRSSVQRLVPCAPIGRSVEDARRAKVNDRIAS